MCTRIQPPKHLAAILRILMDQLFTYLLCIKCTLILQDLLQIVIIDGWVALYYLCGHMGMVN